MTMTREDRERASWLSLDTSRAETGRWIVTGDGGSLLANTLAAAFAAHREAERERVAKMLDEQIQRITEQPYDFRESATDGAAIGALRFFAAKIRSGR